MSEELKNLSLGAQLVEALPDLTCKVLTARQKRARKWNPRQPNERAVTVHQRVCAVVAAVGLNAHVSEVVRMQEPGVPYYTAVVVSFRDGTAVIVRAE